MITSCLKVQVNNFEPVLLYFTSERIEGIDAVISRLVGVAEEQSQVYRDNDNGWTRTWEYNGVAKVEANSRYNPFPTYFSERLEAGHDVSPSTVWGEFTVTDRGYASNMEGKLINCSITKI